MTSAGLPPAQENKPLDRNSTPCRGLAYGQAVTAVRSPVSAASGVEPRLVGPIRR
jgi:hypothetical protein